LKKQLHWVAAQRNDVDRMLYRQHMLVYRPDQLVFADETGSNKESDLWRMRGRAPRGCVATASRPLVRGRRISVLAAFTFTGAFLTYYAINATFNAELFLDAILNVLLPSMNPWPEPNSVLVLDNCSIHKTFELEIREACNQRGIILEFLPAYSPDYNPIEEAFHCVKAWLRRHGDRYLRTHCTDQDYAQMLVEAMASVSVETAQTLFRKYVYNLS
jgi:hypothetical protein